MQALVSSLESKIVETEKKYEETNKLSEERLKQAMDAESLIVKLKTNMHTLVFFKCLFKVIFVSKLDILYVKLLFFWSKAMYSYLHT